MIFFQIFSWLFIIVSSLMILFYVLSFFITYDYFKRGNVYLHKISKSTAKIKILILIPVLREQNTIIDTIKHFELINSNADNLNICLCIACTKREFIAKNKYNYKQTTYEIVTDYIKNCCGINILAFESPGNEFEDRAMQLNYSLHKCLSEEAFDIIGVYDADSRPSKNTFNEVSERYLHNKNVSIQQPAFFIDAANKMYKNRENPLLIANALYQNTWSIISEIPMWYKYSFTKGTGRGYYYFIGHGEFFPVGIINKFSFPEKEVTDGIQIGYRLAMSGKQAEVLYNYCSDDAPHSISSLIQQHKRWFGGCQRLWNSYSWCKNNEKISKISIVIAGVWSQFRWAFTANLFILNLIFSVFSIIFSGNISNLIMTLLIMIIYAYIFPIIAILMTPIKRKVGIFGILLLPIAIFIKSIGPNLYLIERLFLKKIDYKKVER